MSESSESWIGPIIFIVTFVGLFILLLGNMPSGFIPPDSTQYNAWGYVIPPNFSPRELGGIKYFMSENVTFPAPFTWDEMDYDFNTATPPIDYIFRVNTYSGASSNTSKLMFWHRVNLIWIFYSWDDMLVEGTGSSSVERWQLVTHVQSGKAKFFPVQCEHISMTAWISDSNATRNNVLTAWDEKTITISLGLAQNVTTGALSGWDMVGRLLTFQTPEILGLTGLGATIMNAAIALPIWAMIGYLIYRLILLVIPFLG